MSGLRRTALRLTAAAAHLGIPKGGLDLWCCEGVLRPSFTRKTRVSSVGTLDIRYFLTYDLDALNLAALELREKFLRGYRPQIL